jgi:predicted ATPase/DNA-binding XRE family transcriptional regulator
MTMPAVRGSQPFATLLRRHRVAAGLSQEALAERAGISVRGLSDLERGLSRAPRLHTLGRLADALGLEADGRRALAEASGYGPVEDRPTGVAASRRVARRNLPGYLTGLLGREQDAVAIDQLLRRPDLRLLTLTGPGGVGKTRLAVQVAADVTDLYADGVVFVPLAPLRDAALVAAAIARAVGVGDTGDVPLVDSLAQALHPLRLLLVLDNCEHVLAAAPLVAELLVRCPTLTVLATSRTRLRVQGEHSYPVRPLVVPDASAVTSPEAASAWPAVALFVQRAQAAQPTFSLTAENVGPVVAICRRLDGLPLALELAAARAAVLPPAALLARLEQPIPVLCGGARDAPARHRALRDTIAWSHDLLSEDQQRVFRRLGVFAGGCTLAAAEQVCADAGGEGSVLDDVAALVEHSLLQPLAGAAGEPRFGMLETIRAHALERLEASGELAEVRRRHAAAFLRLAEETEPHLVSPDQVHALGRLELELDNIRSALAWSAGAQGDAELGQRLVGSLAWYWYLGGLLQEGRTWAERLLARGAGGADTPGRARARLALGGVAAMQGDPTSACPALQESVALFRAQGDWPRLAKALTLLGLATTSLGEPAAALALYDECMTIARRARDPWLEAYLLTNQGAARDRLGDASTADELYRSSLELFSRLSDAWGSSIALRGLGKLAAARGDHPTARALYEESVAYFRKSGDAQGLPQALLGLGKATLRAGDGPQAEQIYREALARWQQLGIGAGVVRCLAGLAGAAAAQGRWERAARLYAAAAGQARVLGVSFAAADQAEHDRTVADLRARLGEPSFAAAWSAGQAMSLDQAIADALGAALAAQHQRVAGLERDQHLEDGRRHRMRPRHQAEDDPHGAGDTTRPAPVPSFFG